MKVTAVIGASVLGLLLGTIPAKAQHGHEGDHQGGPQKQHENDHQRDHGHSPAQHSERHEAGGPPQRHESHAHEQQAYHQPAHRPEPSRAENHHQPQLRPARDVWQPHRAQHWEREHHTWRERGGYHGERIPEVHFHEHFGRGHWFRVHSVPIIVVNSYPRFQYGGYWFTMVDPWPEYWSATWYQTDDVSIDYVNDGYYLYNRRHPGVAIAVNVSF